MQLNFYSQYSNKVISVVNSINSFDFSLGVRQSRMTISIDGSWVKDSWWRIFQPYTNIVVAEHDGYQEPYLIKETKIQDNRDFVLSLVSLYEIFSSMYITPGFSSNDSDFLYKESRSSVFCATSYHEMIYCIFLKFFTRNESIYIRQQDKYSRFINFDNFNKKGNQQIFYGYSLVDGLNMGEMLSQILDNEKAPIFMPRFEVLSAISSDKLETSLKIDGFKSFNVSGAISVGANKGTSFQLPSTHKQYNGSRGFKMVKNDNYGLIYSSAGTGSMVTTQAESLDFSSFSRAGDIGDIITLTDHGFSGTIIGILFDSKNKKYVHTVSNSTQVEKSSNMLEKRMEKAESKINQVSGISGLLTS